MEEIKKCDFQLKNKCVKGIKMYNVRNIDNIKVMYFYGDGQKR